MSSRRDGFLDRLSSPLPAVPTVTDRAEAAVLNVTGRLAPHEPLVWFAALTGLFLDVALTAYGLSLGLTELNPVARGLMETHTPLGVMLFLKTLALLVAGVGWLLVPPATRVAVPACLAVPWWFAVLVNVTLIGSVL